MSEQYVIKKITAMYPKLDKTYRYDNEQQRSVSCGATDDGAEYSVNFIMDDATAKALWSYMKTTYAEEKKRTGLRLKTHSRKQMMGCGHTKLI